MVSYDSDPQMEQLKAWWAKHGNALMAGVLLGVLLLAGISYWRTYQQRQAESASAAYSELLGQVRSGQTEAARTSAGHLVAEFGRTAYAGLAALWLARSSYDAGDKAAARTHLEWAVKHASDPAVEHAARLRLGHLLIETGDADTALALADISSARGLESEYAELKGDALVAKARIDDARTAYRRALELLPVQAGYRRILNMKLDDLGPAHSEIKP